MTDAPSDPESIDLSWRSAPGARRQRAFLVVAVVAAVVAIAGLVVSLSVKSPAQLQAEQAPPSPSVLTAQVTSQQLTESVTVRGTVESPASTGVRALSGAQGGQRVVTGTPVKAGDTVSSGQVLLELSGRPLIVFSGATPAYRDLVAGTKGADVTQVQNALVQTGDLASNRLTGTFDWWTQVAVAKLYKRLGYATVGSGSNVSVPLSELAFVATLPATVATVTAELGAPLSSDADPVVTLNTGAPQVRAMVAQGQQVGIAAGQTVHITDDVTGRQVDGTVASIGAFTSGTQSGSQSSSQQGSGTQADASQAGYPVIVQADTPLGADWLGANVRVQIMGASTDGAVLVVPSAAIVTDPSGGASVIVRDDAGTNNTVPVRTGMTVDGMVQVTPSTAGALHAGDRVVTG